MAQCLQPDIYSLIFTQIQATLTPATIILSVCLPAQLIFAIVYYCCKVRHQKQRNKSKQIDHQNNYKYRESRELDKSQNNLRERNQGVQNIRELDQEREVPSSKSIFSRVPIDCQSQASIYVKLAFSLTLFISTLIFLIVALSYYLTSIRQTFEVALPNSDCFLVNTTSQFIKGTDQWMGLQYYPANLTFLDLILKTRVRASKNSIKSLLLNGTGENYPIGFTNNTPIYIANSQTDSSQNTVITTSNVQTYIDAALRQWLYRNSSLSTTNFLFPICQNSTIAVMPHPLPQMNLAGQTVELDYMNDICSTLKAQVDELVENGKQADSLLVHLGDIETNVTDLQTIISDLNETTNTLALRSSEYENEFSSLGVDYSLELGLGIGVFVLIILVLTVLVIYIIYFMCKVRKERNLRKRVREYDIMNMIHLLIPAYDKHRSLGKFRSNKIGPIHEQINANQVKIYDIGSGNEPINMLKKQVNLKNQDDEQNEFQGQEIDESEFVRELEDLLEISENEEIDQEEDYEEEKKRIILGRIRKIENRQCVVLPRKITTFRVIVVCLIGNILTGLLELKNGFELEKINEVCAYFESSLTSSQSFNNMSSFLTFTNSDVLNSNQKQLLTPIQSCTQKILSLSQPQSDYPLQRSHFLETSSAKTIQQLLGIQQIYKISSIYNASIPRSVFDTESITQITVLQNYLIHMETIPINTNNTFNILQVLAELNLFANGSANDGNSEQVNQCGTIVLEDQYVYNVDDCLYPLIDYQLQPTVTDPRCIQIPTYDGSSGTSDADLNNAQHTIVLNSSCPTMIDFFNSSLSGCFLAERMQVLEDAGCSNVASEYASRVQSLVSFSLPAGSYTNSYLQNLRNFFGVYAVMNTNLSDFFANTNTSGIIHPIGNAANNVINKTLCSWVSSKAVGVYDQFCSSDSTNTSFSAFYFDSYVWLWLIWFGVWLCLIILGIMDIVLRQFALIEEIESKKKYFRKKLANKPKLMNQYKNNRARIEYKESAKKLAPFQESQQSFRRQYNSNALHDQPDLSKFQRAAIQNIFIPKQEQGHHSPPEIKLVMAEKQQLPKNISSTLEVLKNEQKNDSSSNFDEKRLIIQENSGTHDIQESDILQKEETYVEKVEIQKKKIRSESALEHSKKQKKMQNLKKSPRQSNKVKNFFETRTEDANNLKSVQKKSEMEREQTMGDGISKLTKSEKESRRLKVVELGEILENKIETIKLDEEKVPKNFKQKNLSHKK